MARRSKRKSRGVEAVIAAHQLADFCDTYMRLVEAGQDERAIAEKLAHGYIGRQATMTVGRLRDYIEQAFTHARGSEAFRAWYALRQGDPGAASMVAETHDKANPPEERWMILERERDGLLKRVRELQEQLKKQASTHELAIKARVETETQDAIRRLTKERNDALTKKSEAEYAAQRADKRIGELEDELSVLRRRPAVDANKLAELETTRDGLNTQITRLRNRLTEVEEERDEKDKAFRQALSRVAMLESTARKPAPSETEERAPVVPIRPRGGPQGGVRSTGDILDDAVAAGLMTKDEAYERLRRMV